LAVDGEEVTLDASRKESSTIPRFACGAATVAESRKESSTIPRFACGAATVAESRKESSTIRSVPVAGVSRERPWGCAAA
jgi:hypothetical protein